jgi:hypothetical protein
MHHNLAGYSGTNGNAVHVHDNKIYDNSLGIQTDVVTGAGHPGFPGDSAVFEDNHIYSNNFNAYGPDSDVKPAFPFPVGTGLWIAGGNHHKVRGNHFYDNWRRGTMIFAVPDALVCGAGNGGNEQAGCDSRRVSTSHYNQTHDNKMGITPDGKADRNGIDFWWDQFGGTRGNCWYRNYAAEGRTILTSPPGGLPDCDDGKDPASSTGTGNPQNEGELVSCVAAFETRNFDPNGPCPWLRPPTDPDAGGATQSALGPAFNYRPSSRRVAGRTMPVASTPLGQMTCFEWNRAAGTQRPELIAKIRGFAGGVVNDGQHDLGTGAVLTFEEAQGLYDTWCANGYAQEFTLVKLYTHAAAFGHRH